MATLPEKSMTHIPLFPFVDYWWFYGLFTLFVLAMLALDLGVFHRKAHAVSVKEAFIWTMMPVTKGGSPVPHPSKTVFSFDLGNMALRRPPSSF